MHISILSAQKRGVRWSAVLLAAALMLGLGAVTASGQAAGATATASGTSAASTATSGTAPAAQASPASAPADDDAGAAKDFPPGPGRATVIRVCTRCHGLDEVEKNQDVRSWAATLNLMIQDGAQGTNADFNAIFNYLTTYFGTNPPPTMPAAAAPPSATPTTPGSSGQPATPGSTGQPATPGSTGQPATAPGAGTSGAPASR